MRILYLATDVFSKGGIPRYSRYQIKALREIVGENNVIVFSYNSPDPEISFEEPFFVHYIQGDLSRTDKFIFLKKALNAIKKYKIDLIIVNHVQFSIIGYIAQKLYGIKYYTNVYGIEIWTDLKYRSLIGLRNSDKIIGDCNFILSYIEKKLKISRDKMFLLHDPVDIERFKPLQVEDNIYEKYNIPKDKFILMTTGRLDRYKGFELIIRSLPDLPNNIIYVIVGDGRDRDRLEKLTKDMEVQKRVFFTGRVPEDDLAALYNICDLFILISKFGYAEGEGLPLTLIEAAACEKPIICGNQDGSVDSVDDGVNGFIVSPDDIDLLKEKVIYLYENNYQRDKMGKEGRKKVMKEFSFTVFLDKLKKII